jgi:hypothetical protein
MDRDRKPSEKLGSFRQWIRLQLFEFLNCNETPHFKEGLKGQQYGLQELQS